MRSKFSEIALTAAFGLALAFTLSCSDSGGGGGSPNTIKKERISGVSQKGPFVAGTTVKIYELDANLKLTKNPPFEGKTDDNGNFQIGITNGELTSQYIVLEVSGNYVSEVNGNQSTTPITLKAVADVSVKNSVNINVLTHLEYDKVLNLARSNIKFEYAKKAAQKQVLNALGINETGIASEDMALFGSSASDSTLLLASIILQANRSTDDVIGLLAAISNEINSSGTLSGSTKSEIANGVDYLYMNMDEVKNHLPPNAKAPSNDDVSATLQGTNTLSSNSITGVSSSSIGNGSNGKLVTETYDLMDMDEEQFTYKEVYTEDRCRQGGTLVTESEEYFNTINYSIANKIMTCFMGYEDTDTLRFKGTSNALIGTWTRTKNKATSCGYEYEWYSCKEGYDITKAVFTQTTVAITRDECPTDREEEWTDEYGWKSRIIDCNKMEISKGSDKITVIETRTSSEVSYKGKTCKYDELSFTPAQKQAACREAWSDYQNEVYWEDHYYDILEKDWELCLRDVLPEELFRYDDDDYYESSLGKVAAKPVAKAKSKSKLMSLLKKRN